MRRSIARLPGLMSTACLPRSSATRTIRGPMTNWSCAPCGLRHGDLARPSGPPIRRIEPRGARAAEHRAIFGHVVAHGCPPYETEFGRRHVFGQSQELGDIRGFYEAFGVRPRPGGERPAHVACELEFLALLALKEALAVAGDDEQRLGLCRGATRSFL